MIGFKPNFQNKRTRERIKTFDQAIEKVDGKKVLVNKERVKDPNEGLSYTDFSIQSLLDADATDLLQPIAPISRGELYTADSVGAVADNLNPPTDTVKTDEDNKE